MACTEAAQKVPEMVGMMFQASPLCLLLYSSVASRMDNDNQSKTHVVSEGLNVVFINNIRVSRIARQTGADYREVSHVYVMAQLVFAVGRSGVLFSYSPLPPPAVLECTESFV
jgi:hypothetical protein